MAEQFQAANTQWVDIVDEQNEVIAQSSRQQIRLNGCAIVLLILCCITVWEKFWCSVAPISTTFIQAG